MVTLRGALAPAVLLALAACTTPAGLDRTMHGASIEGRMSVRYTDLASGREDGSSGRFVWTTDGDALELSLQDPLGQTVALVRADGRRASVTFRDGRRVDGDSPEALTRETLGWTVPLSGLRSWLDGRTDAARPAQTLSDGRVVQDGWTIRFDPGTDADPGAPPKRIDLSYPGPPAAIALRLVVDARSAS